LRTRSASLLVALASLTAWTPSCTCLNMYADWTMNHNENKAKMRLAIAAAQSTYIYI
jgi:hypothetical protein